MSTLYRKYRPQSFSDAVGQNHIKIILENQIKQGNIAHAYLFCGPRGIGKTTFARIVSKAINCAINKDGNPCNKCDTCQGINNSKNLDIIEIDAASHTGVDNVRENIINSARIAPSRCKYKVFIIDEAHMLSTSAFNALLKIMEEPPESVVFILCTTEIHKMPATIISRCQRFDFKRIRIKDIAKRLGFIARKEGIKIEASVLESIARRSEGHMRDAESLLGQVVAIGGKEITKEEADLVLPRSDLGRVVELVEILARKDASAGVALINRLIDEGTDLAVFTKDLIEIMRKIMLSKISANLAMSFELGEDLEIKINKACLGVDQGVITIWIEKLLEAKKKAKDSFIIQLPLEMAIVEICLGDIVESAPAIQNSPAPKVPVNMATRASVAPRANIQEQATKITSTATISNKEILQKWNEVLVNMKKHNHSLSFILRACQPRDVKDGKFCIAFKYKFHKDRVNETQIRPIIEKVLNEVYGEALTIDAVIDEELVLEIDNEVENNTKSNIEEPKKSEENPVQQDRSAGETKQDDMMTNILNTFGGKVVN